MAMLLEIGAGKLALFIDCFVLCILLVKETAIIRMPCFRIRTYKLYNAKLSRHDVYTRYMYLHMYFVELLFIVY